MYADYTNIFATHLTHDILHYFCFYSLTFKSAFSIVQYTKVKMKQYIYKILIHAVNVSKISIHIKTVHT